jgi:hypothetical protein
MNLAIAQAIVDALAATDAALRALGDAPDRRAYCCQFLERADFAHAPLRRLIAGQATLGRLVAAPSVVMDVWEAAIVRDTLLGPSRPRVPVVGLVDKDGLITPDIVIAAHGDAAISIVGRWNFEIEAARERKRQRQLLDAEGAAP